MKKVGILVGREKTFPENLIKTINERGGGDVIAEMVEIGGIKHDEVKHYDLIIDRISHEIPYYRAFLKKAALEGTIIINNPFWWSADDKFFNFSLAAKLGVAIPKTVLLPHQFKRYCGKIIAVLKSAFEIRNSSIPLVQSCKLNLLGDFFKCCFAIF